MSRLEVVTEQVAGAADGLAQVPMAMAALGAAVAGTVGAADGTPAAGAYDAAVGRWMRILPEHAQSVAGLATSLGAAAECYRAADVLPEG